MSLTDTEKDQLAAPSRLEELPPPPFDFAGTPGAPREEELPVIDLVPDTLEEAEPSFLIHARKLVATSSDSAMARSRLAQAAMAVGKRAEAGKHALKALDLAKKNADNPAVFSAARILMANGEFEPAEQALQSLSPSGGPLTVLYATLAAQRGDLDTAFSRLDDDPSVDAWDLRGWIALRNRHFDQAVRFYRQAMRKREPSPALLTNLGLAHAALGAPKKAIAETRRALALGPVQRQRVAFNLIAFLFASGHSEYGFQELKRLQGEYPNDIEPVFAEAHWALAVGDSDRAERRLRNARTSLWAHADEVQQAELLANLAYLQRYRGELSPAKAADEVIAQMRKIKWQSTRVVSMVPFLLDRYSDLHRLEKVYAEISEAHPDQSFYPLDIHVAVLQDRLQDAKELSLKWASDALFAAEAASLAVFMLTQIDDDRFDESAELGLAALKRMPAASVLANNTAYSLTFAGKPDQAKRLLSPEEDGNLYHVATRGLIAATQGDIEEAVRLYDHAEQLAQHNGAKTSPLLVRLHRRLIAIVAQDADPALVLQPVDLPSDWNDHPSIVQCLRMLKRRGAPLEGVTVAEGHPIPEEIAPRI